MRFILLPKWAVVGFALLFAGSAAFTALRSLGAPREDKPQAAGKVTVVSVPYQDQVKVSRDSFFVDYNLQREISRSRQLELLREIATSAETDEATRKRALEKLILLSERAEKEAFLERILRAKGFKEAAVAFTEQGVTVIVPGRITPEESATIATFVYHAVGVPQEQVVILGRE